MQSNASSVATITLMIEPNVQLLTRPVLSVADKDTLPLSARRRIVSHVHQPTKVHHTSAMAGYAEGGKSASDTDESE